MRILALSAFALLASAATAVAAPASIDVTLGPAMQAKAAKTYGVREINDLASDLKKSVERQLAKSGAYDGAKIELTLVDAIANRPTMKQMSDKPGLSFESFGVGGAKIEGTATTPDGKVTPLAYKWYETDIRWAADNATWSDAQWTFQRFAHRLAKGETIASR